MGYLTRVWVDSSHRAGDSQCQSGVVFHDPIKNKQVKFSSDVYTAINNNDSEILGIYFALKAIYEQCGITNFRVFNDSVIACEMLRADKVITKKTFKKYPVLKFVREYFDEKDMTVRTEQINRNHKMMKVCDKYSKRFRHKEKTYE